MGRWWRAGGVVVTLSVLLVGARAGAGGGQEPNDPLYPQQTQLRLLGVPEAWERSTGEGVTVALLEVVAGPDPLHEDLQGQVLPGIDLRTGEPPALAEFHATGAAGIVVAAANNGKGIAGVAPGAKVLPVINGETGEQIRWAVDHGARVLYIEYAAVWLNTLLPTTPSWETVFGDWESAARYATDRGAVVLGGAGNFSLPWCSEPANWPEVLCVGASDDPQLAWAPVEEPFSPRAVYSNWGFGVDVLAPSGGWTTAYEPERPNEDHRGYARFSGTSGAVAYAAGVAALLVGAGASGEEAARVLRCTADDLGPPGPDLFYGHGRINAAKAMAALGTGITCPPAPRRLTDLLPR